METKILVEIAKEKLNETGEVADAIDAVLEADSGLHPMFVNAVVQVAITEWILESDDEDFKDN